MGILMSVSRGGSCCCNRISSRKHPKVLKIVKPNGKTLEYGSSILVRDVPSNIVGSGIGLFRGSSQNLPPDYQLKVGEVYYVSPDRMPLDDGTEEEPSRRIKVVITKQQLQLLLAKQISVREVVAGLDKKTVSKGGEGGRLVVAWRPSLETIAEGVD